MTTQLLEQVRCDDGCGRIIEYGTPRVHIDSGFYSDPALSGNVDFVGLDFVDFDHVLSYIKQQAVTVQALVDQAVAAEAVSEGAEIAPGLSQNPA